MAINFHKIASYTALILLSSLPLSVDVFADAEKKSSSTVLSSVDKNLMVTKLKLPA